MRRTPFLVAVLAVSGPGLWAQETSPYDAALERLVQSLISSLPEEAVSQHPRIAVGCFVCGDGKVEGARYTGRLGEMLATDISNRFVQGGKLRVVTREDLRNLINEKDFWLSDMVNGTTVPKSPAGFSAFTLLVRGKYFADIRKDTVKVAAEIVDVEKGEVQGAASIMLPTKDLPVPPDQKELGMAESLAASLGQTAAVVTRIRASDPYGEKVCVRVWIDGDRKVFRAGEKLQFKVCADRDAYVWLFDVRPDRKTVMIFPNAYHQDNFLRAGQVVTLPSESMKFDFFVEEPFGPEAVQAVATTSRLVTEEIRTRGGLGTPTDTATPFKEVAEGTKGLAETIENIHLRGVGVAPKEAPPAWAEDHWTFVTEK